MIGIGHKFTILKAKYWKMILPSGHTAYRDKATRDRETFRRENCSSFIQIEETFFHSAGLISLKFAVKLDQTLDADDVNFWLMGGSPGLAVMGGDSRSRGCAFESQHQILNAHFSK